MRVNSDKEQLLHQNLLESYRQMKQGELSFEAMMKKNRETVNSYFDYMIFEGTIPMKKSV